jgi:transposase
MLATLLAGSGYQPDEIKEILGTSRRTVYRALRAFEKSRDDRDRGDRGEVD